MADPAEEREEEKRQKKKLCIGNPRWRNLSCLTWRHLKVRRVRGEGYDSKAVRGPGSLDSRQHWLPLHVYTDLFTPSLLDFQVHFI